MTPLESAVNINWYEFEYLSGDIQYNLVPSKIEAEDYYINYGVEIENCSDAGGGKNLSYIDSGDYLKYLISVSKPGSYKISLRTAGFESGVVRATLSSENSSDEFLYTFTTPRTNGWQSWQTVSEDLIIMPGDYTLTLNVIEGGFNFNWFEFQYNEGEGFKIPGKIEAEEYFKQSGLSLENCNDEGGGSNLSYMDKGDFSNYLIYVSSEENYKVSARVSSDTGGGEFSLEFIDGLNQNIILDNFEINNTGGWQNWETIEKYIVLPRGTYEMRMNVTKSSFNLNWVEFEVFSEQPEEEEETIERVSIYPNPAKNRISIESNILFSKIIIRDIHGRIIRNVKITETDYYSIDTPFTPGYYFVSIKDSFGKTISNNPLIIGRN